MPRQIPMPGLYFGDCGPGLLHLKLYLLSGDDVDSILAAARA